MRNLSNHGAWVPAQTTFVIIGPVADTLGEDLRFFSSVDDPHRCGHCHSAHVPCCRALPPTGIDMDSNHTCNPLKAQRFVTFVLQHTQMGQAARSKCNMKHPILFAHRLRHLFRRHPGIRGSISPTQCTPVWDPVDQTAAS